MAASPLTSIGARAMFANYAALQTIGNNIANANTAGYSRQSVELVTAGGQSTGFGFFGRGVDVATVSRAHDRFLTREAGVSSAIAASDQARSARLTQLERVFAIGDEGVGHSTGEFLNAFSEFATRPQDLSARQVVLARADELASRFRAGGEQLNDLQNGVTQDLKNSLSAVNSLAKQVGAINQQIINTRGTNHTPNDLLDQRDLLVSQMNAYVQVTSIGSEDGSVSLFVSGGQTLVSGGKATPLVAVADPYDAQRFHVGITDGGTQRALPDSSIVGGSVAGLLRFQSQDLDDARNLLGQMASAISVAVNRQQSFGLDLRTPAGQGAALFTLPDARALAASTNARDTSGSFVASVGIAIVDAAALQPSDYELRADPAGAAGAFQLTRLRDGRVRTVASGDTVDGFRIDVGSAAPAAGDIFRLQPVALAGSGMRRAIDDPKALAAAAPFNASVDTANQGTTSVSALRVTDASFDPMLRAQISFTSSAGAYSYEMRDASNNLMASGSGSWTPGTPITLNGWELDLSGTPAVGDAVRVEQPTYPEGNNGNALALLNLRDQALVGRETLASGATSGGATFTGAYANVLSEIGVRVQGARSTSVTSEGVARQAETQRTAYSGVNLDEEAARLIQFQQSYQAAAKMLQVAQTAFDALLQATSR